jgi:hypothetical protein
MRAGRLVPAGVPTDPRMEDVLVGERHRTAGCLYTRARSAAAETSLLTAPSNHRQVPIARILVSYQISTHSP